jgi:hypothetical protein
MSRKTFALQYLKNAVSLSLEEKSHAAKPYAAAEQLTPRG